MVRVGARIRMGVSVERDRVHRAADSDVFAQVSPEPLEPRGHLARKEAVRGK